MPELHGLGVQPLKAHCDLSRSSSVWVKVQESGADADRGVWALLGVAGSGWHPGQEMQALKKLLTAG